MYHRGLGKVQETGLDTKEPKDHEVYSLKEKWTWKRQANKW